MQRTFFQPADLSLTYSYLLSDFHLSFPAEKTQIENVLLTVAQRMYSLLQRDLVEPVVVIVMIAELIEDVDSIAGF